MSLFEGVEFRGTFRGYQQRVLDNLDGYVAKGKLNIVAAPGSGKTILGLEIIRRLGEACLIISPTNATRDHWGKRFSEYFLGEERALKDFFSTDLEKAGVINAITYEDLEEYMESYADDGEKKSFKLRRMMREGRIHTICLEEPHHLNAKCLTALENMRELLEKDVKFLSLTTTPPCGYEEAERKRFFQVCGEIDVRISASELVAEKILCPYQERIYFSAPSKEEAVLLQEYVERVQSALEELGRLECVQASIKTAKRWDIMWAYRYNQLYDKMKRSTPEAYIPMLQLLQYYGLRINKYRAKQLTGKKKLPPVRWKDMQIALQFLTDHYDILGEHRKFIMQVLRKYNLYQRKKVQLVPDELIQKIFLVSVGKLVGIREIVGKEYRTLGKALRLLVFTEGIPANVRNVAYVGTQQEFTTIDVISIFETVRRQEIEVKIGVLANNLLILPIFEELQGTMMRMDPLGDTGYAKVDFFGGMPEAVDMVKDLFREGKLQVLIGDQALLEEDWVESGINSLILPGFTRDFSLANAMCGIALQRAAEQPEKNVNIWHLTTWMPEDGENIGKWRKGSLGKDKAWYKASLWKRCLPRKQRRN